MEGSSPDYVGSSGEAYVTIGPCSNNRSSLERGILISISSLWVDRMVHTKASMRKRDDTAEQQPESMLKMAKAAVETKTMYFMNALHPIVFRQFCFDWASERLTRVVPNPLGLQSRAER